MSQEQTQSSRPHLAFSDHASRITDHACPIAHSAVRITHHGSRIIRSGKRLLCAVVVGAGLTAGCELAGAEASATVLTATNTTAIHTNATEESGWSFSASVYTYFVPDSREYVQPTFTADHGWLHLEARYNYEDRETGSAWIGYNFAGGEKLAWEFTPMLGGVFGHTTGIAPGYRGSVSWWKLDLYSESEYFLDTGGSSGHFFYSWSELGFSPVDWLRVGVVLQRTRLYQADRDVQPGVLAGLVFKRFELTGYVFNPDESKPIFVLAAAFHF